MRRQIHKVILIVLIILVLSTTCFAKEIFDKTVKEETDVDVGGRTVNMVYYESQDKISMNIVEESKYVLVGAGDCTTSGLYEYCFDGAVEEEEEIEKNGLTLLDTYFNIDLRVNKQAPEITLAVTIPEEVGIDNRFNVEVKMTNEGDLDASNVNFEMTVPSDLTVISTTMSRVGDKLMWSTPIGKGKSAESKIVMKTEEFGEFELESSVEYESAGEMEEETNSGEVEVDFPYNITSELSIELAAQNEPSTYTLTVNNIGSEILDLTSIEIEVPSALDVKSVPTGFTLQSNTLRGTGQVSVGESGQYSIKLQTGKVGEYEIKAKVHINMEERSFDSTLTNSFGVGVSGLIPTINISEKNPGAYDAVDVNVYLYNRDTMNHTTEVDIMSDLFASETIEESNYGAGEKNLLLSKTITMPTTEEEIKKYVEVTGSYINDRGMTIEYSAYDELTISPPEKIVKLTQDATVDGDEVEVTVIIENLKEANLSTVEIFDLLPKRFKVTGDQMKTISIGPLETVEALTYKTTIPSDYSDDEFIIEHTVNIQDENDEFFIQEIGLRVDLSSTGRQELSEELNPTNSSEEVEKVNVTEDGMLEGGRLTSEDEDKPGFFSRVWRGITGIFKAILSSNEN